MSISTNKRKTKVKKFHSFCLLMNSSKRLDLLSWNNISKFSTCISILFVFSCFCNVFVWTIYIFLETFWTIKQFFIASVFFYCLQCLYYKQYTMYAPTPILLILNMTTFSLYSLVVEFWYHNNISLLLVHLHVSIW